MVATLAVAPVTTIAAPGTPTAPRIESLRLTRDVTAPQGRARILVGARLATTGRLRIEIRKPGVATPVRSLTTAADHMPGRVYALLDAVDDRGFQLPAGTYAVAVRALADARLSNTLTGGVTITTTGPIARLDAAIVPMLPAFARQLRAGSVGQYVAVTAPGGALARAGVRRGDVIESIAGRLVGAPGAFQTVTSTTPANVPVPIVVRRGATAVTLRATLRPEWTALPDLRPSFTVALRRSPDTLALQYAAVRYEVDSGRLDGAAALVAAWPTARRDSGVGQLLVGQIALARGDGVAAFTAFQRAVNAAPGSSTPLAAAGYAWVAQNQFGPAADTLGQATTLDPADAEALATRAFALLRLDRPADALAIANQAVAANPGSANAIVAQGIALIANGSKNPGLAAIRRGLLATASATRAASIIEKNLEPNDP